MSRQFTVVWRLIYGYTNHTHPTGNLDSHTEMEVVAMLKSCVAKYGQTLVMITHDETIAQMADRTLIIEDGKVVG